MSRILAAPWAAQLLGDLGADVIKVERPEVGDDTRHYGQAIFDTDGVPSLPPMFLFANRNKRSITIDFSKPEGAELVRQLAARADILIENYLPGVLGRFGLDYESLRKLNPRLIYCSVTGYGQDGPQASRPGYDAVFQAVGGLMSVTGLPDSEPGGGPMKTGPSLVDVATGYVALTGILAALHARERTGEGDYIDACLLDTVFTLQSSLVQGYLISHQQPTRKGTEGNGGHPARVYTCRDGDIYISAGHQGHYQALCRVLGLEALIDDPRFANHRVRTANRDEWSRIAIPVIAGWEREALVAALVEAKVPVAPVNGYADAFADEQVIHRGLRVQGRKPQGSEGVFDMVASPVRLANAPATYRLPPPLLGQHTDEVLSELGFDAEAISALRQKTVI